MMKKLSFICLFLCFGLIYTLNAQSQNIANIGFYNVENLFDTINDPNVNDEEFLPEGKNHWTSERYWNKLDRLSEVISMMADLKGGLPILGISEIENEQVLLDLVATKRLAPYKYKVCHHDSPDRRGIDVAFIYQPDRFRILETKAFPLRFPENPDFITRDQWMMKGVLDNTDTLHVIVNHWPSKRGGEKRSMPYRKGAAALSKKIADSLMKASPNANVIIMGDLNDNPTAVSMIEVLGTKTQIKTVENGDLYNPMHQLYRRGFGSYCYRDNWDLLDNIIISSHLVKAQSPAYHFDSVHIFRRNFMVNQTGSFIGYPFRTLAGGTYYGGYSDHFPVYIVLTK